MNLHEEEGDVRVQIQDANWCCQVNPLMFMTLLFLVRAFIPVSEFWNTKKYQKGFFFLWVSLKHRQCFVIQVNQHTA